VNLSMFLFLSRVSEKGYFLPILIQGTEKNKTTGEEFPDVYVILRLK
jgi:hypothetical protein